MVDGRDLNRCIRVVFVEHLNQHFINPADFGVTAVGVIYNRLNCFDDFFLNLDFNRFNNLNFLLYFDCFNYCDFLLYLNRLDMVSGVGCAQLEIKTIITVNIKSTKVLDGFFMFISLKF